MGWPPGTMDGWSASRTSCSIPTSGATRSATCRTCSSTRPRPPPSGASRYYWQTKQDNARARALYDKLARFRGFIRYDYSLE